MAALTPQLTPKSPWISPKAVESDWDKVYSQLEQLAEEDWQMRVIFGESHPAVAAKAERVAQPAIQQAAAPLPSPSPAAPFYSFAQVVVGEKSPEEDKKVEEGAQPTIQVSKRQKKAPEPRHFLWSEDHIVQSKICTLGRRKKR